MSTAAIRHSSRIRTYWCVWLAIVACVLLLRFTVFLGASRDSLLAFACIYGVGTWLSAMALTVIEGRRLSAYLRKHQPQKWQWLTHSDAYYGSRLLSWFYASADDLGDPVVGALKKDHKRFLKWMLTVVFLSYIVVVPILLVL